MEGIAIVVADFDGVTYHLSNPDEKSKTKIMISIGMGFFKDLLPHGLMNVMSLSVAALTSGAQAGVWGVAAGFSRARCIMQAFLFFLTISGYDVSLLVDLETLDGNKRALLW